MIIFGAGWAAVFLVFTLLLRHAMRKRDELELSELEIFDTQVRANKALINIGVGLTSVLVAAIGGTNYGGLAGPVYPVLLAPGLTIYGALVGRKRRLLERSLKAAGDPT